VLEENFEALSMTIFAETPRQGGAEGRLAQSLPQEERR
jgi:hypothetical protein